MNDVVAAMEQIVLDHVDDSLPKLKELAAYFCMSGSSLKRRFWEKHGETINSYFLKKKMAYARFLIEQRGYSMGEVSRMVGYKSLYHFLSKYKKYNNNCSEEVLRQEAGAL